MPKSVYELPISWKKTFGKPRKKRKEWQPKIWGAILLSNVEYMERKECMYL